MTVRFEADRAMAFLDRHFQPVEEADAEIVRTMYADGRSRTSVTPKYLAELTAKKHAAEIELRDWEEDKHPRDDSGRFSSTGGEGTSTGEESSGGSTSIEGGGGTVGGGAVPLTPEQSLSQVAQLLPKSVDPSVIPRDPGLSSELRAIETKFAEQLAADPRGAWERYMTLNDARGGKVFAVDVARSLNPEYLADPSKSAAVHEPASWFIKEAYAARLQQDPALGENAEVLFMAGGTGAGKTTAIRASDPEALERSMLVYDGNFSSLDSHRAKINDALAAGKRVIVEDVDRDPYVAFVAGVFPDGPQGAGVLTRAMTSGRTVPVEAHLATHIKSRQTVPTLEKEFSSDSRVEFRYINNNFQGKESARRAGSFAELPVPAYNSLRKDIYGALERAHREGRISEAVYRGTLNAPESPIT